MKRSRSATMTTGSEQGNAEDRPQTQSRHSYNTRSNVNLEQPHNNVALMVESFENMNLKPEEHLAEASNAAEQNPAEEERIQLSEEQENVLSSIRQGRSVFFTGPAGTGKTMLLRRAVNILKDLHGEHSVFVTASTGIAASALNGTTLHSFAGIGCALEDGEGLVRKVLKKRDPKFRWKTAKALVIDEINMIDGELFDKLNFVAKRMKEPVTDREFGGLQMVVTGDFFQLPPVNPQNFDKFFAFQADCWDKCFDLKTELKIIFRQSDSKFKEMLNEIRRGICSAESADMLKTRQGLPNGEGLTFTKLYPLKVDVVRENEQKLRALDREIVTFHAQDSGGESARPQLESLLAVKDLSLCVDAQVMLISNLDTKRGLVNGRRGVVIGFQVTDESPDISPGGVWPVVRFEGCPEPKTVTPRSWDAFDEKGEVSGKRIQVPLILAWALSVHKCQGMTLERVETDLSTVWESAYGMVYLVLSRLRELQGLRLTQFEPSKVQAHPKVIEFYEKLSNH